VTVSVTVGGGVGWEVTAGGVSVDVVVVVNGCDSGCVVVGCGSVEEEGEGSAEGD